MDKSVDDIMAELDKARSDYSEWAGCVQCGDTNDISARFTRWGVCGKCARANHKKATR